MIPRFFPNELRFWFSYLGGWAVFALLFDPSGWQLLNTYGALIDQSDSELFSEALLMSSSALRFFITLPVLLSFRYFYIRNDWISLPPFEMLSLSLGYNMMSALLITFILPFGIEPDNAFFELYARESIHTPRATDEWIVSFCISFSAQVGWCLIYIMIHENYVSQALTEKEKKIEKAYQETKIENLASKISPHFIFNGINNVITLIDESPLKAKEVLRSLSKVLRETLSVKQEESVDLAQEINLVEAYLSVCSIQYEERLQVSMRLESACLICKLPPLSLQCLVENAVKFGIKASPHLCEIIISVTGDESMFHVEVSNPGSLSSTDASSTGIGLDLVKERLALLYGERASCQLFEKEGRVIAQLHLPREHFHARIYS